MLKYDRILALSEWHKKNLMSVHNLHSDHVVVTRNGIDLNRFKKDIKRNRFKVINSSSPDRSWPVLLECWPSIKAQVPEAELHLFYGFKNWECMAQNDPNQLALIDFLKKQIESMKDLGVVYHDRINQDQLAEEFLSSGMWIYPTWFSETSCITAMEAQAAGCRIVTSPITALNETVGNRGAMIPGDWTSLEYKQKFINTVVLFLEKRSEVDREKIQKYAQDHFGLDELAQDWENMLQELLEEVEVNPFIPYQPIKEYV